MSQPHMPTSHRGSVSQILHTISPLKNCIFADDLTLREDRLPYTVSPLDPSADNPDPSLLARPTNSSYAVENRTSSQTCGALKPSSSLGSPEPLTNLPLHLPAPLAPLSL